MLNETKILNYQLNKHLEIVSKYVESQNKEKSIKDFSLKSNGFNIKVIFETLDQYSFIPDNKILFEPDFYFKYEKISKKYELVYKKTAFKYIYLDYILKKLDTETIEIVENDLLIVAKMKMSQ